MTESEDVFEVVPDPVVAGEWMWLAQECVALATIAVVGRTVSRDAVKKWRVRAKVLEAGVARLAQSTLRRTLRRSSGTLPPSAGVVDLAELPPPF